MSPDVEVLLPDARREMIKIMSERLPNHVEAAYYVTAASNSPLGELSPAKASPAKANELFKLLVEEFRNGI